MRVTDEPAYVLHRYDWSESSLIVEMLTHRHGRVALVAKGAKKPNSNFRPVLLPMQPLRVGYAGDAEVRTLKGAEWVGGHVMPTGDALLSGYYLNELLLRLIARDDPHPNVFDAYATVVRILASEHSEALQPAIRTFELLLLKDIGLLPALDAQTLTLSSLEPDAHYQLVPEAGLVLRQEAERQMLSGSHWRALQAGLDDAAPFHATLRVCALMPSGLKSQLRTLLHYHCGVSTLRTRQMMLDLQKL